MLQYATKENQITLLTLFLKLSLAKFIRSLRMLAIFHISTGDKI